MRYPRVLILKEKFGDRYLLVNTEEELVPIMLRIMEIRLAEGCWYDTTDGSPQKDLFSSTSSTSEKVQQILDAAESGAVINKTVNNFFMSRRDHEYENWFLELLENVLGETNNDG